MDRTFVFSLHLQMLLYFSSWYDVLFAAVHVLVGLFKWRWLKGAPIIAVFGVNYLLCFMVEPFRLYLGYAGNLGERVPELFLFVFVSFFLIAVWAGEFVVTRMLPLFSPEECSLVPPQPCVMSVERASWLVRIILLLGELMLGMSALRRLIHEQSARFFVSAEAAGSTDTPEMAALDAAADGRSAGGNLWSPSAGRTGPFPQAYGRQVGTREHQD
mmetsp:Transcript_31914/g.69666  ORF Transcript_31914/g.69666 Transcript_31914/m.69666 type:complete len:215 (+) Transcript_31914:2-646(+)